MGGTKNILNIWENGGAYVGLELCKKDNSFEYWIGMFTPEFTDVPDNFLYMDFEKSNLGICWIYGKESEVHDTSKCKDMLKSNGMEIITDKIGAVLSFENCLCQRFTTPEEKGNVILDSCYFVK